MKFNWKKIITAAVAAMSVAAVVATAAVRPSTANADSNTSSVSAIKKRGTLRVAVFGDLPPYGWVNKNGKRVGYDVALARQMAKDMGVKVKFVQVNANNRVDTLNSNKADIVLANFT
ncbi:transporter substrate-binding domain-containing protein, partial [Limosilactobacillus coleohominis]